MWDPSQEAEAAERLGAVLERYAADPVGRRLRLRLAELGAGHRDEVAQFRLLQRACRESEPLARALAEAGFPDLSSLPTRPPTPLAGFLVQAFNRWVRHGGWLE